MVPAREHLYLDVPLCGTESAIPCEQESKCLIDGQLHSPISSPPRQSSRGRVFSSARLYLALPLPGPSSRGR